MTWFKSDEMLIICLSGKAPIGVDEVVNLKESDNLLYFFLSSILKFELYIFISILQKTFPAFFLLR